MRLLLPIRNYRLVVGTVCALLLLGGGVIAWNVHQHHRYKHFAVHDPGKVVRSAWVDDDVFAELIPKYNIRTVVNLCYPGEMGDRNVGQRRAVEAAGARLIELEFPPNDTWDIAYPAVAEMERILTDETSYPLWIHCQHGRERTVKALAIYDIRLRGMTAKESLDAMPRFSMEHPWPVVAFAFGYESAVRGQPSASNLADDRASTVGSNADRSSSGTPRDVEREARRQ